MDWFTSLKTHTMKTGIELITEERARQISDENWTAAHDDDHENGELARAAATYALPKTHRKMEARKEIRDAARGCSDPEMPYPVMVTVPNLWPWEAEWWRPTPDNRVRELVKAGALIAAEIDRLTRAVEVNPKLTGDSPV